ncbi:MAG: AMP-binding protein [Burkholderiaceae bacterium]|nr:AMP-binding protein [Burkholderiaceae bacterium]
MPEYYDELETRDPELREREQLGRLPLQIAHAKAHAPAFARILCGIDPAEITSRAALARLPVTRKSELIPLQKAAPPFGGFAASHWGDAMRVFASPGPIFEPEGRRVDYWRFARSLFAAGFRARDLVHNCFSYHFTPAGSMIENGATALGCTVFPGGVGQTEQQVQVMAALEPDGYAGTPSFLKIILDRAESMGVRLRKLRKALFAGEAFPAALRDEFLARGIDGYQGYGTADIGTIAYETAARDGLLVDEGVLVEIVRPGTGDPAAPGEVGEVVVTTLYNTDYPLIRFGTGDLSAFLPGASPCGRTNQRIRGWMGRADQTAKVRGLFVHPSQVAAIVRRHPGIGKARLVIDNETGADRMTLHVEVAERGSLASEAIVTSIREITKLRGAVVFRVPGELPDDGKAIEDTRAYGRE